MSEITDTTPDEAPEEVVPDYSRVGFKGLRALCKDRGLPADGSVVELIGKLQIYDRQHGKDVDLSAADSIDDDDPLGLDEDDTSESPESPESPVDGGEAASAPPSTAVITGLPVPDSVTTTTPAVVVIADPDQPKGLPRATTETGKPDLTVKDGQVKVGEGHGAAEVRAFRVEFPHGPREITDSDHFSYIAEAHAAAWAKGLQTKGGTTIGQRVGASVDASGRRTVIYQVPLKRQQ